MIAPYAIISRRTAPRESLYAVTLHGHRVSAWVSTWTAAWCIAKNLARPPPSARVGATENAGPVGPAFCYVPDL